MLNAYTASFFTVPQYKMRTARKKSFVRKRTAHPMLHFLAQADGAVSSKGSATAARIEKPRGGLITVERPSRKTPIVTLVGLSCGATYGLLLHVSK
jgi:hypothetical protein